MQHGLTAVYKKIDDTYLGWVEEISGVDTQGKTMREVKANLKDALRLVIDENRKLQSEFASGAGTVIREKMKI